MTEQLTGMNKALAWTMAAAASVFTASGICLATNMFVEGKITLESVFKLTRSLKGIK